MAKFSVTEVRDDWMIQVSDIASAVAPDVTRVVAGVIGVKDVKNVDVRSSGVGAEHAMIFHVSKDDLLFDASITSKEELIDALTNKFSTDSKLKDQDMALLEAGNRAVIFSSKINNPVSVPDANMTVTIDHVNERFLENFKASIIIDESYSVTTQNNGSISITTKDKPPSPVLSTTQATDGVLTYKIENPTKNQKVIENLVKELCASYDADTKFPVTCNSAESLNTFIAAAGNDLARFEFNFTSNDPKVKESLQEILNSAVAKINTEGNKRKSSLPNF